MQTLNYFYNGNLENVTGHNNQLVKLNKLNSFFEYDDFVNSYHNKGITEQSMSIYFEPLAISNNVIKSFKHKNLHQYGIMWHPERNDPFSDNDINLFKKIF